MTFKWNNPEVMALIFAYAVAGMLLLGYAGWGVSGMPVCYFPLGAWEAPLGTRITQTFTSAGYGALTGFVFIVSVLYAFAYAPERLWRWLKGA